MGRCNQSKGTSMTDKDLIKQALEALENVIDAVYVNSELEAIEVKHANIVIAALKERLEQETALQALHNENERLGLYKDAYAQPEPDELNIAYMSGLYDGKKTRPWVGLTDREMMDAIDIDDSPMEMGRKIEAKLKEKNS